MVELHKNQWEKGGRTAVQPTCSSNCRLIAQQTAESGRIAGAMKQEYKKRLNKNQKHTIKLQQETYTPQQLPQHDLLLST